MDTLTRIGTAGVEAVVLYVRIIPLLQQLQTELGSPEQVIAQLRAYVANPDPNSPIGTLAGALGVELAPLQALINQNQDSIASLLALFQPVQAFGTHQISYPLARTGAPVSGLTLQGSAELAAILEGETDGKLLNGMVAFDPAQEVYLHFGVTGTLKGSASGAAPVGSVAVQGAFEVGADLAIDNYFRHPVGEATLAAIAADIPFFTLPGRIGAGAALRSTQEAGKTIPGQYVRVSGSGLLKLGGSVTWSQSFLSTANVTEKSLDLDTQVRINTGLEATVSFSYQLNGTFDILVFTSPVNASRVRVQLAKSQTSAREIGLQLGANIGIDGLDKVGQAVLGHFLPTVEALIKPLAGSGAQLADLRGLFAPKLDGELDTLLAKQAVIDQIKTYLQLIDPILDLKAKLKDLVSQKVLQVTGAEIDALQANLDKVTDAFKDLIRKYRQALDRINSALQQAAHAKIGLVYARSRRQVETAEVALELDLDPQSDHDLYLRMLQGDFAAAIAAARETPGAVTIVQGALRDVGAITRTSSLSFTAFGKFQFDQTSILSQNWETSVSPTGEISIGVSGEVQASTQLLHEMRTAAFFVDARVLGLLLDNGTLGDTGFEQKASLELTHEITPSQDNAVVAEDQALRRLGALTDPGVSLVKDLVFKPQESKKKFGTLSISAFLELGQEDLKALLAADPGAAQREFVAALGEFIPNLEWLQVQDAHKTLPFLLWPSVQGLAQSSFNPTGLFGSQELKAPDGSVHSVSVGAIPLVRFGVLLSNDFRRAFGALRTLQTAGPQPGETRDQVLARLRNLQRTLLNNIRNMIAPPAMFDRYRISQALFLTWARLIAAQGGHASPFVTIQRKDDGKIFTFT